MDYISEMNNLVTNLNVKECEAVTESVEEKEEFKSFLEQTILEKCKEIGSKIDNAQTWEEQKENDKDWWNLVNDCYVFMTREEFIKIRDKAENEVYEEEVSKVIDVNTEDITVDIVKNFVDINTNLYWKIINENDLGIFALCEKDLMYNPQYYMKAKGLKHRVERQPLQETVKMYSQLKRDYIRLTELEKEYIQRGLNYELN